MPVQRLSSKAAKVLIDTIFGRDPNADQQYIGMRVWTRCGKTVGVVTGTGLCRMEGCGGTRLHVKWPDGKRTYPCAKGCTSRDNGDLQIE